ncbi:MAG: N-acetylneuraminate synthase family protein [Paraglaciecola sp.]|uniref:N-acetylneuraminate synthase family protein n=1 Tax=Paraglaciecola sp. TaxID=1920173 RepID=UPI003297742F
MVVDKEISKYLVATNETIANSLEKLNQNKLQILFVVDSNGRLRGAFTDGDFRRWVLEQVQIDLSNSVQEVMNPNCQSFLEDTDISIIEEHVNDRVRYLPLLDNRAKVVAVVSRHTGVISIGNYAISKSSATFIIAEIGNNHNGCIFTAKQLVDQAVSAGADCVKFQMRDLDSLYVNKGNSDAFDEDLGSQYVLELLSKFQLKDDEFLEIIQYSIAKGVIPLCTPFDKESADKLVCMGIDAFKVASADLTNHELLKHLAKKRLPLIVSTGMATENEIRIATDLLRSEGVQFALLHCNSTYPAPFKDINLNYLPRLEKYSLSPVGYSGHERGIHVAIAAVAMGARIIEKHFTLDREQEGNDHKVSLLPVEFKEMVQAIRQVELAFGDDSPRKLSQGEMMNRESLAKSIVAQKPIQQGSKIEGDMLTVKSPGKGLAPYYMEQLIGRSAVRDIKVGEFFYPSDIDEKAHQCSRNYSFMQPFGIPVRYHDLALSQRSNFSVVEYHFSYKDLLLNPEDYVFECKTQKLIVHAPELFEGDHLLDLANIDDDYRELSITNLNRVFDLVRKLKVFYPACQNVPVVVNVGGFSSDQFLNANEKEQRYGLFVESLSHLNLQGIEFMIQTMPPYPWHFGGQRYHNLFVDPVEIEQICQRYNLKVCLDVSHSWLACNEYQWKIADFFERIGRYVRHLHIADAAGVDDEGLQIGEGEVNFKEIFQLMEIHCSNASWIPEIWQGHKNHGEGFWDALEKLELEVLH